MARLLQTRLFNFAGVGGLSSVRQDRFAFGNDRIHEFHPLAMNLFAMHRNIFWRNDSQLDAIALHRRRF